MGFTNYSIKKEDAEGAESQQTTLQVRANAPAADARIKETSDKLNAVFQSRISSLLCKKCMGVDKHHIMWVFILKSKINKNISNNDKKVLTNDCICAIMQKNRKEITEEIGLWTAQRASPHLTNLISRR